MANYQLQAKSVNDLEENIRQLNKKLKESEQKLEHTIAQTREFTTQLLAQIKNLDKNLAKVRYGIIGS